MAGGLGLRMGVESGVPPHRAVGEHVVQHDGIDAAKPEVRIGMHVIVVRHGRDAVGTFGLEQEFVCDRAAERGDTPPSQILQ